MQVEEIFIWGKNERKAGEFRYSMTITIRPLVVHGPGPQKLTFRYHSGGVMLSYVFENCNYSSFILCMIAMLNE